MAILPGVKDPLDLRRLSEGDPFSANWLDYRYRRIAYSLAIRITGEVRAAEAVVVEAFTELSRYAKDLDAKRGSVILFLVAKTRRFCAPRTTKHDRDLCDFWEMETTDYPECVMMLATRNACRIISGDAQRRSGQRPRFASVRYTRAADGRTKASLNNKFSVNPKPAKLAQW